MDFAKNDINSGANYFGCSLIYVGPFRGNTGQERMWVLFISCFDSNFKQEYVFDRRVLYDSEINKSGDA